MHQACNPDCLPLLWSPFCCAWVDCHPLHLPSYGMSDRAHMPCDTHTLYRAHALISMGGLELGLLLLCPCS